MGGPASQSLQGIFWMVGSWLDLKSWFVSIVWFISVVTVSRAGLILPRVQSYCWYFPQRKKLERFSDFCNSFHIPIISLVDEPGFMIGPESEKSGTIRFGTAAISAIMQSRVPWASVHMHKSALPFLSLMILQEFIYIALSSLKRNNASSISGTMIS